MTLTPEQKQIDTLPLSLRDTIIHNEWLAKNGYMGRGWYRDVYLKTDHWQIIKKECAIWWEGRCALSKEHYKLPMHIHHRDYEHLWQERYCDVIFICQNCHERYHEIWPDVNCKLDTYLAKVILHKIRELFNKNSEETQAIILDVWDSEGDFDNENFNPIEIIKTLTKDSLGQDSGKRTQARKQIPEIAHAILYHGLGYFDQDEEQHGRAIDCLRLHYEQKQIDQLRKICEQPKETIWEFAFEIYGDTLFRTSERYIGFLNDINS